MSKRNRAKKKADALAKTGQPLEIDPGATVRESLPQGTYIPGVAASASTGASLESISTPQPDDAGGPAEMPSDDFPAALPPVADPPPPPAPPPAPPDPFFFTDEATGPRACRCGSEEFTLMRQTDEQAHADVHETHGSYTHIHRFARQCGACGQTQLVRRYEDRNGRKA